MNDIKSYCEKHILLFDGAMGTYYARKTGQQALHCELANLYAPQIIADIHREYVDAGCKAIKTNTFGANRISYAPALCDAVLEAGIRIAKEAAGECAVFADIGPVPAMDPRQELEEYRYLADTFLSHGVTNFIFETFSRDTGLHEIAAYIHEKCPNAFLMFSFSAQIDGYTGAGEWVQRLFLRAKEDKNFDAVGLNCGVGPVYMARILSQLSFDGLRLCVLPNAGYPTVVSQRTDFCVEPEYFAKEMGKLISMGAGIVGGCCGTTPAHIQCLASLISEMTIQPRISLPAKEVKKQETVHSLFWQRLCDPDTKPIAVELDPPENSNLSKFLASARQLQENGVDILTIADCPVAKATMDASLLACKVHRELSMEVVPHMTCRDRNLNATKGLLLGLSAEGVGQVLVITGDPVPTANRDEVKSVYNFNSRRLAAYIRDLEHTVLERQMQVFGALNLNAGNFRVQLLLAQEKEENGMCAFFTQPVLSPRALKNLKLARETLKSKIVGGIFPIVSERNARFIHSEVAGIQVAPEIIEQYVGADRAEGERIARSLCLKIGKEIAPYVDGYYLMTPFGRTALVSDIIQDFRREGLCGQV